MDSVLVFSRHERPGRTNPTETLVTRVPAVGTVVLPVHDDLDWPRDHLRSQVYITSAASRLLEATQRNAAGDPDSQWHRCSSTNGTARHGKSQRRWGTGTRRIILQCQLHSITEHIDTFKRTGAFHAGAPLAGGGGARRASSRLRSVRLGPAEHDVD